MWKDLIKTTGHGVAVNFDHVLRFEAIDTETTKLHFVDTTLNVSHSFETLMQYVLEQRKR